MGRKLTPEERIRGQKASVEAHRVRRESAAMRREAELWLLNKLLGEMAMPEWYPHEVGGRG